MPTPPTLKDFFCAKRYLVIEDFDNMRQILRDLLLKCGGKRIDLAADDREAITAMSKNAYDVVLCDYHLGKGRNGQQLLEEARHYGHIAPSTIFIMVTAEKTAEMVMGIVEFHPDDYLVKPITEAMLQNRLLRLIKRRSDYAAIEQALKENDYTRAIELCNAVMASDRATETELTRRKAEIYLHLKDYPHARATYEKQMGVREVSWASTGLAKVAMLEGHFAQAQSLLEKTIRDNPAYLEAHDWLARALTQQDKHQEAQKILQHAVSVSPHCAQRQRVLGDVALKCADLDTADQAYRRAMTLSEKSTIKTPDAHIGLAHVHTERGDTGAALKVLAQVTNDFSSSEARLQARAAQVKVHLRSGDSDRAHALAEELANQVASGAHELAAEATLSLAEALMEVGKHEQGSAMLQFVARNHGENDTVIQRAQAIYSQSGLAEEGARLIEAARTQAVTIMDAGVRLASQGKLDEGLASMREAMQLLPNNPRLLLNHAWLITASLEKQGWNHDRYKEALRLIDTARRFAPGETRINELRKRLEKLIKAPGVQ